MEIFAEIYANPTDVADEQHIDHERIDEEHQNLLSWDEAGNASGDPHELIVDYHCKDPVMSEPVDIRGCCDLPFELFLNIFLQSAEQTQ